MIRHLVARLGVFVLGLLLLAVPSQAQVTYDNATFATDACPSQACGGTTQTVSFTVGSGSNRQLAVFASIGCNSGNTAATVSTVTYAGVGLSQTVHRSPSAANYVDLWTLPAGTQPTSGANNIVLTYSSSNSCTGGIRDGVRKMGAIAVAGVDQSTTYTATNGADGTGTSSSVTLSSSGASDLVVHSSCAGSILSAPTGTSRWHDGNDLTSCNDGNGATASGGTTTLSSTIGASDSWVIVAGSFKAAAGGGLVCTPTIATLGVGRCG